MNKQIQAILDEVNLHFTAVEIAYMHWSLDEIVVGVRFLDTNQSPGLVDIHTGVAPDRFHLMDVKELADLTEFACMVASCKGYYISKVKRKGPEDIKELIKPFQFEDPVSNERYHDDNGTN